ncbi:MAG: pyridoxal phosphate-dependent aminotransferase [Vulcanimicrobiaceae bacterium]
MSGVNARIDAIQGSVIRALNDRKKKTSIDLGLGEPTLLPTMRYFDAAMQWVALNGCRYTPTAGDVELRESIAKHYGYPALDTAQNVIVSAGSQEALAVSIKSLLDPERDSMLVVEPAFPVYAKCAQMEGIAVESVQLDADDGFAFDAERIAAAVNAHTRMIVICSPCNPTARVITREQAVRLGELLSKRGGDPVYVLHDEVYRELLFTGDAGRLAQVYPHTVVVNSLSKSNALTGMRLGWVMAPKATIPTMTKVHAWLVSTANTYAQRVALEIFRDPNGLQEHVEWYRSQRASVLDALTVTGLEHLPIDCSFYAAVHVGRGVESMPFAYRLLEESDVVAIPGSTFGSSFEGWLRCSWVAKADSVRDGFRRIAETRLRLTEAAAQR